MPRPKTSFDMKYGSDDPMKYLSNLGNIFDDTENVSYMRIDMENRIFLFRPTSIQHAKQYLLDRDRYSRLAKLSFKLGSINELGLSLLPSSKKINIEVPTDFKFDYGIIEEIISLINTTKGKLKIGPTNLLSRNIHASIKLPNSVNTPEIMHSNISDGYYIEEYIEGKRLDSNNLKRLEDVYRQLATLYEDSSDQVNTDDFVSEVSKIIFRKGYIKEKEEFAQKLLSYDLPSKLNKSFIHGNLSTSNIIINSDNNLYIDDWSLSRTDYTFVDFYYPYHLYSIHFGDTSVFDDMISSDGRFGRIHRRSAKILSDQIYGSGEVYDSMPLIYLLYIVAYSSDSVIQETAWNSLKNYV